MASFVDSLKKNSDDLFVKRQTLLSLWQHLAEHFYPERADFTVQRNMGAEFGDGLTTSYPVIARRELGDIINSMMRPRNQKWFDAGLDGEDDIAGESKGWLERATKIQRKAMYDADAGFVRATKEADHDFVTFGQCVISVELNRKTNSLMYRNWHLRDVAWVEEYTGRICEVHRRSKNVPISKMNDEFSGKISKQLSDKLKKDPNTTAEYRHVVMKADRYTGGQKFTAPYVSIYFESETGHILREDGAQSITYVIPRWETVSGSQYAYSPATVAALPDARLMQAMTLTLLEAGEMATNPPMFARQEIFRGDVQRFAGGITYADLEADQNIRDALDFQPIDSRGIGMGMEMAARIEGMIARAFYLDRLNLPQAGNGMTAYEVSQRITEYIRNALPLFEPMEQDYNSPLCDVTFELLLANGAFGPDNEIPEELQGSNVQFSFESPLHQAIEKQKAQTLLEGAGVVSQMAALDPSVGGIIKAKKGTMDALEGIGYSAEWMATEEELEQKEEAENQAAEQAQMIEMMKAGGEAAQSVGAGAQAIQGSELTENRFVE